MSQSAADKIIKEMEMFGTQFENYNEEEDLAKAAAKEDAPVHVKAAEGKCILFSHKCTVQNLFFTQRSNLTRRKKAK